MNLFLLLLPFLSLPQENAAPSHQYKLELVEIIKSDERDTVRCPIVQPTVELNEEEISESVTMYADAQTDIFYTFTLQPYMDSGKGIRLEVNYYCTHYGLLQMKKKAKVFTFNDKKEIFDSQYFEYHDRLAERTIFVSFKARVKE